MVVVSARKDGISIKAINKDREIALSGDDGGLRQFIRNSTIAHRDDTMPFDQRTLTLLIAVSIEAGLTEGAVDLRWSLAGSG